MNDQKPFDVLVIDDEARHLDQIADYLEGLPRLQKWVRKPVRRVLAVPDTSAAIQYVRTHCDDLDIVLTDLYMPDAESGGLALLAAITEMRATARQGPCLVIVSAKPDAQHKVEDARRRYREWFRFVIKPAPLQSDPKVFHYEEVWAVSLERAISDLLRPGQLAAVEGRGFVCSPDSPLGLTVLPLAEKLAATHRPLLLLGETGVGKSALARLIHDRSGRAAAAYELVDCMAEPETCLESRLFGHVKGAFAGAAQNTSGVLEQAAEGTVFLRRIDEMPDRLQAKLFCALRDGRGARVGSNETWRLNARLIMSAGTDRNAASPTGAMRPDLCHALQAGKIHVPALHERTQDVPALAEHFLQRYRGAEGVAEGFEAEAISRLVAYSWPGNVRELEQAVLAAAARTNNALIASGDLDDTLLAETGLPLERYTEARERRFRELTDAQLWRATRLSTVGRPAFDRRWTARALGVPVSALVDVLRRRGIVPELGGPGLNLDVLPNEASSHGSPSPSIIASQDAPPAVVAARTCVVERPGQKVEFGMVRVHVNGREFPITDPWRLLEYMAWREQPILWLEGFLIFPTWWRQDIAKPRQQFREKVWKCIKTLQTDHQLDVEAKEADESRWRLIAPGLATNISEANSLYEAAKLRHARDEKVNGCPATILDLAASREVVRSLASALEKYPRHLESNLLLARCYIRGVVDEPGDRIWKVRSVISNWASAIQGTRRRIEQLESEDVKPFLAWMNMHPVFSQIQACLELLDGRLEGRLTGADADVLELKKLLERMANAQDAAELAPRAEEFVNLPYVREVIDSIRVLREGHLEPLGKDALARLLYPEDSPDVATLRRIAAWSFDVIGEFQRQLREELYRIAHELACPTGRKLSGASDDVVRKAKIVGRLEQELEQRLRRRPSKDELRAEITKEYSWSSQAVDDILAYRSRSREDRSIE